MIVFLGVASSFLVLPPHRVIRSDGSRVTLEPASALHKELIGMWNLLKDWRLLGE